MASRQTSIIEGIEAAALECSLCLERFKNPKLLPCIHTFCIGCLAKWVKENDGKLTCPICREICEIPTDGLQNLKNNIFINGLLDYVKTLEQKYAPTCACNMEACFFCRECEELYCRTCRNAHIRMKMSKDHCIITLEEYTNVGPLQRFASKSIDCAEHSLPLQFFCDTCKIPVCVSCIPVKHPKGDLHNIVEIKDAFEAFSKYASELIETSDVHLLDFRQTVEGLKEKERTTRSNYIKRKSDITKQAEDLHRLIDRHREEQMQDLETIHQQDLKLLEAQINDVETSIAKLNSMRGIAHNLSNSPNHAMALVTSSDTCNRFNKLLTDKPRLSDENLDTLKYNLNSRLSQLLVNEVVNKLNLKEMAISPEKSTIDIEQLTPNPRFPGIRGRPRFKLGAGVYVTTRNASGESVYDIDASVKCLGLCRTSQEKMLLEEIIVTDEKNGSYQISSDVPFSRRTLICMIVDRSGTYANTIDFDKTGNGSMHQSHFQRVLNTYKI